MKKIFFYSIFLFLFFNPLKAEILPVAPYLPATESDSTRNAPITVQHPQEKAVLPKEAKNIYLFGKINLKSPSLQINGVDVPLHKNGTFLTFLPVEQGNFQFLLTAQSEGKTYQAQRNIVVAGTPIQVFQARAKFDPQEIYPSKPAWFLPGDTLLLSARGTPGACVKAHLYGLKNGKSIELKESSRQPGLYQARFSIHQHQNPRSVKVSYSMYDKKSKTKAKIVAKEKIRILDPDTPLQPAFVKDSATKLRQIPVYQGSLYPFYRAFGEVLIDGRDNGLYRLRLSAEESAWLEEKKLKLFSPDRYQNNVLKEMDAISYPEKTQIRWTSQKQVPIYVQEFNNRLELSFYYTADFEENFNFDSTSALLEKIEWTQPQENQVKFILYFKAGLLWGHSYRYEGTDFVLDLSHRPAICATDAYPLKGARILLDAGHSPKRTNPYDGVVTPSGFLEYELTLPLAESIKTKLEKAGATVIMTREGNNFIGLTERYKKAMTEKAHIFISLHYNALHDTGNPLAAPRGYSVYYTYPHSFDLAESIYKSFNKYVPLPDNGLIADDVLFIPRISEIPSILVENAFPILPEQEEWVLSDKGKQILADTLYQGILSFYQKEYSQH